MSGPNDMGRSCSVEASVPSLAFCFTRSQEHAYLVHGVDNILPVLVVHEDGHRQLYHSPSQCSFFSLG